MNNKQNKNISTLFSKLITDEAATVLQLFNDDTEMNTAIDTSSTNYVKSFRSFLLNKIEFLVNFINNNPNDKLGIFNEIREVLNTSGLRQYQLTKAKLTYMADITDTCIIFENSSI